MDVFKLAFETTIVGILAFVWLGVAAYLLFPEFLKDFLLRMAPDFAAKNQTLTGVALVTFTYCLGSAILPISNQLVNDEHWPLPENAIRCQVFTKQEFQLKEVNYPALPDHISLDSLAPRHCSYWAPILQRNIPVTERLSRLWRLWAGLEVKEREEENKPAKNGISNQENPLKQEDSNNAQPEDQKKAQQVELHATDECLHENSDACKIQKILTLFRQQESEMLNQGTDKTERLRQIHERIVVLRGMVFSGFVLVLICIFAFFARIQGRPNQWIRTAFGALLAIIFTVFALLNGIQDIRNRNIFDLPVLEGLLACITILGVYLVIKGVKTPVFRKKRFLLLVLFFAALAYGGWMSSEILYDQQVISSFAVVHSDAAPSQR